MCVCNCVCVCVCVRACVCAHVCVCAGVSVHLQLGELLQLLRLALTQGVQHGRTLVKGRLDALQLRHGRTGIYTCFIKI